MYKINYQHSNIAHRDVLIEKVFTIKILERPNPMHVWYGESRYLNKEFIVRNSNKRERDDLINSPVYCKEFKERCTRKNFYIILSSVQKYCFVGKCDSIVIK